MPASSSGATPAFDLRSELERLRAGESHERHGRASRALVKEPGLVVLLLALARGGRLSEHTAAARISVHTLAGRARLRVAGEAVELPAGRLLTLERGVPHDLEAAEESAVLVTLGTAE